MYLEPLDISHLSLRRHKDSVRSLTVTDPAPCGRPRSVTSPACLPVLATSQNLREPISRSSLFVTHVPQLVRNDATAELVLTLTFGVLNHATIEWEIRMCCCLGFHLKMCAPLPLPLSIVTPTASILISIAEP